MNRLAKTLIASLSILLILGIAGIIVFFNFWDNDTSEALTIDQMNEHAYETPEITTDLSDGRFVRIQFQIITDGKKARTEIEKREFQIKNTLIKEMAVMTEEDFQAGLSDLEDTLREKLNEVMEDGEIVEVYTIGKILQ